MCSEPGLSLGTRVVINDMHSARTKHFNGLTGVVSAHPRQGHPAFIRKPSCPDTPQLVVCIVFDNAAAARERSALLEPRFLKPFDEAADEITQSLGATIALVARRCNADGTAEALAGG